jgi:hypothetical protein
MSGFVPTEDNLDWLIPHLPVTEEEKPKVKLTLVPFTNTGGLCCSLKKVKMEIDDKVQYFVWKTIEDTTKSMQLGLAREALFYEHFHVKCNELGIRLPAVYYTYGDMKTGQKVMILEDLAPNGSQSGHFFGHHSPLNWGKDLVQLTENVKVKPTLEECAKDAYYQAARLHRQYWMDKDLFNYPWLRCSNWIQGEGKATWEFSQNLARVSWNKNKSEIAAGTRTVKWNENILKCIDASIAKISWDNYQQELSTRKWSLVHADFHPGNIFWINAEEDPTDNRYATHGKSVLLDWEMVSIGSGPQDLAQYMISHVVAADRRPIEKNLIQWYYKNLTSNETAGGKCVNPEEYSFEECYSEFAHGGAEKWIWLITVCMDVFNDPMLQYFQNQMADFFEDHGLNETNIGMPRVN